MGNGTAPAWQVRDVQQEKLIDKLAEYIFDKDEETEEENYFILRFAIILTRYLLALHRAGSPTFAQKEGFSFGTSNNEEFETFSFLVEKATPAIQEFSRHPAEAAYLHWKLLEKVVEFASAPFARWLSELQAVNPKLIYGAPSDMDEVPLT